MKLVIDEKLKHRLVGVSVIISLGAIFLPAIMKKSSQRLENNFSVNVTLPPKPTAPKVVMTDEKEMFKTIKVAKAQPLPVLDQTGSEIGKEDYIQSVKVSDAAVRVAKVDPAPNTDAIAKPIELALSNAAKNVVKNQTNAVEVKKQAKVAAVKPAHSDVKIRQNTVKKPVVAKANNRKIPSKNGIYAVQLASFSKVSNAKALVNTLHRKGYKANYIKTATKNGVVYKVYAGHSPVKSDVMKLKTQLASAMQLHGFVVNTGVS